MRGFEIKFEKSKVQRGHVELWLAQLSEKLTVKRPHYINKSFLVNNVTAETWKKRRRALDWILN